MVKRYNVSDLPIYKIHILTSVLAEYGVTSTLNLNVLDLSGGAGNIARGLPVAEAKAGLLKPMATRAL
jgi:hypothetical protein